MTDRGAAQATAGRPTAGEPPAARGGAARPGPPRGRRRWPRVAAPFAAALLILAGTVVAHSLQNADPRELTAGNTAPHGGSRLAGMLTAAGISIERVDSGRSALTTALSGGDATLFVPAPALIRPDYLRTLSELPTIRIVLVAPDAYTLRQAGIPVDGAATRWAATTAPPGCDLPEARRAGPAAVYHVHYLPAPAPAPRTVLRCYRDALVGVWTGADVLLVGASDPFRNDRIGEHGNAALATGLLSAHRRVIWLELRERDPQDAASLAPGQTLDGPGGDGSAGGAGGGDGGQANGDGQGQDGSGRTNQAGGSAPLPVPGRFWAVLALLVAAALAVALAKARRLGPPVVEPLPVTVRGLETVAGRGRLYQRARARPQALDALRAAALRRLVPTLDLGSAPRPRSVVNAVAERTGRDAEEVRAILYGLRPDDDAALVRAADALDTLMAQAVPDVPGGESG